MFLGDGMGLSTVAAARVYLGDENMNLSFEKFPHIGFSRVSNCGFKKD
jgi:alkaline phosphatase